MNYIIEDSVMSSIADSIRTKLGTSEAFQVSDMASAIDSIPSGGGDDAKLLIEGKTTSITNSASIIHSSMFFLDFNNLTYASFPECVTIYNNAFSAKQNLKDIYFPKCVTINNGAFYFCIKLTSISFPQCTTIGSSAFTQCSSLNTIDFPECITISNYAFQSCIKLTSISFPQCTTIGNGAFSNCVGLSIIHFPKCVTINNGAFDHNILSYISLPECTSIGTTAFAANGMLSYAILPKCTYIGNLAFRYCGSLAYIYLNTSNCELANQNAFLNTAITSSSILGHFGSIYVPSEYVETYKSATNWVVHADRITAIPESMITE